jgi:hypothetical protein
VTPKPGQEPRPEPPQDLGAESLPATNETILDEEIQDTYRKAYFEELRRRSCPGCGETELF